MRLFVGRDAQNRPLRIVGTCIDLSERLRLLCNWPAAAQASPTAPRPMLWVVEPDAALRETLGQMLNREGYAVRSFDQGLSALAAMDHDTGPKPQHLLVAQQLNAELSGLELAIAMRSRQPDLRIVLTLEAQAPAIHTELAHNQGVQQILHKPFDATTWLHALTDQGV
ncbi:response regulator [Leptothrix ochracea]|uniref:response regulator n=1 Tax=Leptothrix ochracea TaxID=735331 RepID=UPI001C102859|nr:response regulator [Leptothrix ochracea]